nr:unnamed protein product [Callosobruchus analis]
MMSDALLLAKPELLSIVRRGDPYARASALVALVNSNLLTALAGSVSFLLVSVAVILSTVITSLANAPAGAAVQALLAVPDLLPSNPGLFPTVSTGGMSFSGASGLATVVNSNLLTALSGAVSFLLISLAGVISTVLTGLAYAPTAPAAQALLAIPTLLDGLPSANPGAPSTVSSGSISFTASALAALVNFNPLTALAGALSFLLVKTAGIISMVLTALAYAPTAPAALTLFAVPMLLPLALTVTPAALTLFAAPVLPAIGLPLASPGLLPAAVATAPAVLTAATFPLLLAAPWLNAIFTLVAPVLFAGPASVAPAVVAALSVAPFVKTAITAPLLPAADPLSAALLYIISLTYNIGFFAPAIFFAALPILIPVIQYELWVGPVVAFLTSTFFPIGAKTAAVATSGLHGATITANKLIQ